MEEIKRKLFHLASLIYVVGYLLLPKTLALVLFGIFILIEVVFEYLRLKYPVLNYKLLGLFSGFYRETEADKPSGLPWTLGGAFLTMLIFSNTAIVLVSLLYEVIGDAAAALIGTKWGRIRIGKKSLEGSLACFVTCLAIGLFAFDLKIALIGALVATGLELIPSKYFNDNFWIPIISATILTFLK